MRTSSALLVVSQLCEDELASSLLELKSKLESARVGRGVMHHVVVPTNS